MYFKFFSDADFELVNLYWEALNSFVPNASPSPEIIREPYRFLMFSGDIERVHWEQMD